MIQKRITPPRKAHWNPKKVVLKPEFKQQLLSAGLTEKEIRARARLAQRKGISLEQIPIETIVQSARKPKAWEYESLIQRKRRFMRRKVMQAVHRKLRAERIAAKPQVQIVPAKETPKVPSKMRIEPKRRYSKEDLWKIQRIIESAVENGRAEELSREFIEAVDLKWLKGRYERLQEELGDFDFEYPSWGQDEVLVRVHDQLIAKRNGFAVLLNAKQELKGK